MCKQLVTPLGALLLGAFASTGANAEIPLAFHFFGQATYTQVKTGGERFSPSLFHFKSELEFTDGILDGIGLQGAVGIPMGDDDKHSMTMEITEQTAAYITLTNPEYEAGDLKVSVLLGYASTEIETNLPRLPEDARQYTGTFSGFSYGFSLQDPILENKPLYWRLDCVRSYHDDNLRVDGCGLGVTYAF
jgi:hypothetical protein